MLNRFRDFFANDKFFLFSVIVTIVGYAINAIFFFVYKGYYHAFVSLTFVISTIIMYTSYLHHEKNVMKGIIGSFLAIKVLFNAQSVFNGSEGNLEELNISYVLLLIVAILFTINHYLINSDHHSNPKRIFINQLLIIVNLVISGVNYIGRISNLLSVGAPVTTVLVVVISAVGTIFAYNVVACIETRLDVYRVEREANGWNPEGNK